MTTTITEKSGSRITSAFRADSATMSPTSPRGVMPHPTAADSWRVIFESQAGIPQPMTFVIIAMNVSTTPKMISPELPPVAGRATCRPREMKKMGVKTAPREPAAARPLRKRHAGGGAPEQAAGEERADNRGKPDHPRDERVQEGDGHRDDEPAMFESEPQTLPLDADARLPVRVNRGGGRAFRD